jgi:thymidylate synthase (FAD)
MANAVWMTGLNTDLPDNYIRVLDKGYVGLTGYMGNDATVINAARVSFNKEISGELTERDEKLMRFLVERNEMSVFRHCTVGLELYMPLMVARQYWKYIVAASHIDDGVCMNESSRRYITEEPVFYIPGDNEWRSAPDNKKQGSGEPLDVTQGAELTQSLLNYTSFGEELYEVALEYGVAAEQARLFLPAYGLYVRVRSTLSLAALIHFLQERLGHTAQHEIHAYASAVRDLTAPLFPVTFKTLGLEKA